MTCIACGKELHSGSKFCKFCGSKQSTLKENNLDTQITEFNKCIKCEASLILGAKFCKFCGESIAVKNITEEIKHQPEDGVLSPINQQEISTLNNELPYTLERPKSEEILIPDPPKLINETARVENNLDEYQVDDNTLPSISLNIQTNNTKKYIGFLILFLLLIGAGLAIIIRYSGNFGVNKNLDLSTADADDLCPKNSKVKFSCYLDATRKIVSVCEVQGKFQYNYGTQQKTELTLDGNKDIELRRDTSATGEILAVRFKNGKYAYEIQSVFGGKPPVDFEVLEVLEDGHPISQKNCNYSMPTTSEIRFVFDEMKTSGIKVTEH